MRALLRLALPISFSLLLQLATGIVATAVLGRLGELELAVGGLAMACLFTPLLIVNGVTSSVGISVAAADGAHDWTTAGACLRAGTLLAGLFALPLVILLLSVPVLLGWLHYDPILVTASGVPLMVLSVAAVPLAVGNVFRQFFAAVLKPRVTVWAALAGLVAFTAAALPGLKVADPSLGMFLVMLGYPVSAAVSLAVYVAAARRPELQRYFARQAPWAGCGTQVRQLFALGLPIGLSFAVESSVLGASSLVAARLGPTALAIHSLALRWTYISFVLAVGVSQATLIGSREPIPGTMPGSSPPGTACSSPARCLEP